MKHIIAFIVSALLMVVGVNMFFRYIDTNITLAFVDLFLGMLGTAFLGVSLGVMYCDYNKQMK
jgi:uncharacterized BrkB/YihY/UPF0761 family membrane protein